MEKQQKTAKKFIETLPEKYQKIFVDKNKNGKPDFFEGSAFTIISKIINLFTQKDAHLYNYQKVNPSFIHIIGFIIIAILIAIFAANFLPFIIFIVIAYLSNKNKKKKTASKKAKKVDPIDQSFLTTQKNQEPRTSFPVQPTNTFSTNDIQDSFSNGIRIVLLLGLIGYCVYLAWPYLESKYF